MRGDGRERTLPEALDHVATHEDERGVTIIDREGTRERWSWRRIRSYAHRTAAALRLEGIEPGDRVLVACPTGFPFLAAFLGTIISGALPVPVPLPGRWRPLSIGRRDPLAHFGERMEARAILVHPDVDARARPRSGPMRPWSWVSDLPTLLEDVPLDASLDTAFEPSETAYIQLTDGTTGPPRGVLLTHRNISTEVAGIGDTLEVERDDVGVSWIPLHNPLGLIGFVCVGVWFNLELVLLDPSRFLKQPESWLRAISRHGGTISMAPTFAYDYAVRRCRESNLEGLDLSSWRIALAGGEPVRAQYLDAFARRFREYGLRNQIFTPVYGLSEATLGATFGAVETSFEVDAINRRILETEGRAEPLPDSGAPRPSERMHLVSVGRPLESIDYRIVDKEGDPVEERTLGEVALRGPTIMRGYIGTMPEELSRHGETRIDSGWLHTGDLGYRAEGRLYVVGRACDRIRLEEGRLVFPEEIEIFVDAVDGVHAGRTAVFGLESSSVDAEPSGGARATEGLVVAFELQSGTEREIVETSLRRLFDRHLDLQPDRLVALTPRSIPRTKSGRVRRSLARRLYQRDMLDRRERQGRWQILRRLWHRVQHRTDRIGARLSRRLQQWFE